MPQCRVRNGVGFACVVALKKICLQRAVHANRAKAFANMPIEGNALMTQVRSSAKLLVTKCNPYSSFFRFFLPSAIILCPAGLLPATRVQNQPKQSGFACRALLLILIPGTWVFI
jgi:hypothetical protein